VKTPGIYSHILSNNVGSGIDPRHTVIGLLLQLVDSGTQFEEGK
jgi:hypothetical protein